VQIGERKLDLRSVSALILAELRTYAEAYLDQPVLRAVITVPAYFNENQRFAVRDAGMQAGLVVERILNEPTAAALAYGYDRAEDKTILVYDLGGGTFDASLLHVDNNVFRVLATGGDTFLGGIDFDNEIVDYLLEQFFAEIGQEVEIAPPELQRLLLAAQEAKHGLTVGRTAEVMLPHFVRVDGEWHNLETKITRDKVGELTGYLVERTMDTCKGLLASQKMDRSEIDVILLVGGQSRMPLIHQRIEAEFGRPPSKQVNPDEAVGLGAGLYANLDADPDKVTLQDVLPIAIGVGIPGGRYQPILVANTPIPAGRTIPLTTFHDDQSSIEFDVFQGDSPKLDDNEFLGTFVIDEIPVGEKGGHSFGVEFALNAECLLIISAINYNTGQTYEKKLVTQSTAEDVVNRLKLAEAGARAFNIVSARAAPQETPGVWSRFSGWLRGLFGGGA
jgi:molecular chaperone DnaK